MKTTTSRSTQLLAASLILSLVTPTLSQLTSPTIAWCPAPSASGTVTPSSTDPNSQWVEVLGDSLYFYDVQRSGTLPDNYRVSWRNDSVLTDGESVGVDLSGGFFDAGNFIKAILPLSWTLTSITHSALLYGDSFTSASQDYYLDEMLRNGFDWLMAASSVSDTLYVNIGNESNAYWGSDLDIPQPRDVYSVTRDNPGTDAFAGTAAALAAGALLYSGQPLPLTSTTNGTVPTSLKNTTYAAELSARAQELMELAWSATPWQLYSAAVPAVAWAYPSTYYQDELVMAGVLVGLATGNGTFISEAIDQYEDNTAILIDDEPVLNWDQKGAMLPSLLARASILMPGADSRLNLTRFQGDMEGILDVIVEGKAEDLSSTSGGLRWYEGYSDSASLNPALNGALLAASYAELASTSDKTSSYQSYAQTQVDYALGKNPMNTVYIVGISPNSATNPHSSLASGGDSLATIDTVPAVERWVLYGGLVGGPNKKDDYYDVRSDYDQSEPALDTVAPMVGLSAYYISQGSSASNPYYVGLTAARIIPKEPSGGLSGGAIAGIVIGVLIILALIGLGVFFYIRKKRRY